VGKLKASVVIETRARRLERETLYTFHGFSARATYRDSKDAQ